MKWFGSSRREQGWLAVAIGSQRLAYVHGRYVPAGKSAVLLCGVSEVEAKPHAIEKLVRDLDVDHYQCATLLRPGQYQLVLVEAPNVPAAELKSAIRWRLKDMLDYHLDDATVDVLDIPPESDLAGRGHQMYAVAAHNAVIQQCVRKFEDARIPLSVIDIPETAQRNIATLYEPEGRGVALLYFNHEFGLLTVNYRGELYLARRIDIGLPQIVDATPEAREGLFGRIVLELQRTLDHFDRQFRFVAIAKLLLGPEPEETGLLEHLRANVDMPVERVDLSETLNFEGGQAPDTATQWRLFHLVGASLRYESKVL